MSLKYSLKLNIVIWLLLSSSVLRADDVADYQKNVDEIGKQIEEISKNLNANKALLKTQRDELHDIEKEISSLGKSINNTDKKLATQKAQGESLLQQLESLENQQQTDKQELADLLVSRYSNGKVNYLKMLLNQENPYAVGRLNNYYQYFATAQQQKLTELREKIAAHETLQDQHISLLAELEKTQAQQLQQKQKLDTSKQSREKTVAQLDNKVASSSEKLQQLNQDRERLNTLIKQIAEQAEKLRKLEEQRIAEERKRAIDEPDAVRPVIRQPVAGGFIKQRGNLSYPVKGNIKYRYGSRLPESGTRAEGFFFNTDGAVSVNSIFSGRVLFADFLKGYGLLLIIDHGDDHISLYGHNELLYKNVGDTVKANEVVAKSGVTGGLKSHGLYFEIRNNATPVDPAKWFQ